MHMITMTWISRCSFEASTVTVKVVSLGSSLSLTMCSKPMHQLSTLSSLSSSIATHETPLLNFNNFANVCCVCNSADAIKPTSFSQL